MKEFDDRATEGIRTFLQSLRQDIASDGLKDTPARYVKAFKEMTDGYNHQPQSFLSRQFKQEESSEVYSGIVALSDITFFSLCEHHLLPFYGTVDVAYIPNKKTQHIVGISKLARLVECYAKRLQVQERMTAQIANALTVHLEAEGVIVRISGKHMCMMSRGVKQENANMLTLSLQGVFQNDRTMRDEGLALLNIQS